MRFRRLPAPLTDAAVIAAGALDVWWMVGLDDALPLACAAVAVAALVLRRRWPHLAFALTLPALVFTDAQIASLIALYTLSSRCRNRWVLAGYALAFGVCYAVPWPADEYADIPRTDLLITLGYTTATAAAPVFLGQLVQVRHDLSRRLAELAAAREQERVLIARTVLASERARLAREMHDVVSHQVSLIAVRAGALQMTCDSETVREAATTIRKLSVNTLDELRHMVMLLRVSGNATPLEADLQPTVANLHRLLADSGIDAELDLDVPPDLSPAVDRTIYRTVQEALTNVRKHAPGATATVRICHDPTALTVSVANTAPTQARLPLPSTQHGLISLRERAEMLGGTLVAGPTDDHGYLLLVRLPPTPDA